MVVLWILVICIHPYRFVFESVWRTKENQEKQHKQIIVEDEDEHHHTTTLRSGRCGRKDKRTKTQHGCTLDGNLNYHFCLPGTHGFAASKHPTWPLAPRPLRGPPWPKTTRRLMVRILPPPPPGSSQRKEPDDHKPTPEPNIRRSPE